METQSSEQARSKPARSKPAQSTPSRLLEKRYTAEWNRPDWLAIGGSILSGLLLGAGCYAMWRMDPPPDYQTALLLGGLVAGVLFVWRLVAGKAVALVGDAGVALEQGGELSRLLWSEIETIRYESDQLVLSGAKTKLCLPSQSHTRAIRAVLAQAAERLPKILDVPNKLLEKLPPVSGDEPASGPVASLQIAGKRCVVTNQLLTFERDARLCPVCTSVYHSANVPETCVTCERPLGKGAVAVDG